jgi:hypothetical protein
MTTGTVLLGVEGICDFNGLQSRTRCNEPLLLLPNLRAPRGPHRRIQNYQAQKSKAQDSSQARLYRREGLYPPAPPSVFLPLSGLAVSPCRKGLGVVMYSVTRPYLARRS